jgi:hypothetical protein
LRSLSTGSVRPLIEQFNEKARQRQIHRVNSDWRKEPRQPVTQALAEERSKSVPIRDFRGDCFVAFTDISGFKMMMANGQKAVEALDNFYQAGFDILSNASDINGFFFSDCGILFAKHGEPVRQLEGMLEVVRDLNRAMLRHGTMLTTALAWGEFSYHNRIEFPGINKQPVYGNAYVAAYLNNEMGKPKLEPGQCRVVDNNVPSGVFASISMHDLLVAERSHHYFYWMVDNSADITEFQRRYKDSYNRKYAGMLDALQRPRG